MVVNLTNWMMIADTLRDRPLIAWALAGLAAAVGMVIAAIAFPRRVYDEFVWQYFWGPVVADAHAVGTSGCAVREHGAVTFSRSAQDCATAAGVVAHPGYTTISTVSYGILLLFAIIGIVLVINRYAIEKDPWLFYGLVPFVFFGGALRVVEDANAAIYLETGELILGLPWVGLIISPFIYFTVFVITAVALLASFGIVRAGVDTHPAIPLAAFGTLACLGAIVLLGVYHATSPIMQLHLLVPLITLGGATIVTILVWIGTEKYWPAVNHGTGLMGAIVIWGHTVDGIANVLSLDWWHVVGLDSGYTPKHVVNRAIIDLTQALQPAAVSELLGYAWPFLPLKVFIAVVVVWIFNDEVFEESPGFSMLMFVAVLAVGLGPGTRDFLRATLGI